MARENSPQICGGGGAGGMALVASICVRFLAAVAAPLPGETRLKSVAAAAERGAYFSAAIDNQ